MGIEKISLTLYDLLGYLLPGYVLLFVCSLIEATFLDSSLLNLSRITDDLLPSVIVAYFLGHACHGVGSLLRDSLHKWFSGRELHLSSSLFERAREVAKDAYGARLAEDEKLDTLETYLLADSYLVASECVIDRDTMIAREGFFKASMVSFGALFIVLLCSLIVGGVKIQTEPGIFVDLAWIATTVLAVIILGLTLLFRKRFIFFNRLKINRTLLTFLALREKDVLEHKE
jgi:hypothetical protein